jgi:hypothetical protein
MSRLIVTRVLQSSDAVDAKPLIKGNIVLLKMQEGFKTLKDIKRIGFVSKVINSNNYEVTFKYIVGLDGPVKFITIQADRNQILNLHLQDKVNNNDNIEKIISVLDKYDYLTNSESHDDFYRNHLKMVTRVNNSLTGSSLLDKLTNRYSNSSDIDITKLGKASGRRSRSRKSRHHKKTNRRRHKSNRRKMQDKK